MSSWMRHEELDALPEVVRLDATGWLLTKRTDGEQLKVIQAKATTDRQTAAGVLDLDEPALVVPAAGNLDAYLLQDEGHRLPAYQKGHQGLLDLAKDRDGAARLLEATITAVGTASPATVEVFWRGPVPGVGADAVVVRAFGDGRQSHGLSFGGGTTLRFTGTPVAATPSARPSNCAPQPKCAWPERPGLPVLLSGWLYRGRNAPSMLVVIGEPAVTRIHIRAGTASRDLGPGAAGLTVADVGLATVPGNATGESADPSVLVYGETATGTVVPALTGS